MGVKNISRTSSRVFSSSKRLGSLRSLTFSSIWEGEILAFSKFEKEACEITEGCSIGGCSVEELDEEEEESSSKSHSGIGDGDEGASSSLPTLKFPYRIWAFIERRDLPMSVLRAALRNLRLISSSFV